MSICHMTRLICHLAIFAHNYLIICECKISTALFSLLTEESKFTSTSVLYHLLLMKLRI